MFQIMWSTSVLVRSANLPLLAFNQLFLDLITTIIIVIFRIFK